ncbi:helix-turn-helix domain-containing protein [Asticcacaulis sp. W401b]|uniref:helix-turn-helix domain-containing protein n=1 Tax=Asticcacaulis sp. W401b TaxID=3388666 RepID=UPI0039705586
MNVRALIGWNVTRLRLRQKLSQDALAKSTAVLDQAYISGLENGKRNPTAIVLAQLASALDVQVGELFSTMGAPSTILDGPIDARSATLKRKSRVI